MDKPAMNEAKNRPSILEQVATSHPQTTKLVFTVGLAVLSYLVIDQARGGANKSHHVQTRDEQATILKGTTNTVSFDTPWTNKRGETVMVPAVLTIGPDGKPVTQLQTTPAAGASTVASTDTVR